MKAIQDKFTKRRVSRQRKWQLRQIKKGLCPICPAPSSPDYDGLHCERHRQLMAAYGIARYHHKKKMLANGAQV